MKFAENYGKDKIASFSEQIFFDYSLTILELYA